MRLLNFTHIGFVLLVLLFTLCFVGGNWRR